MSEQLEPNLNEPRSARSLVIALCVYLSVSSLTLPFVGEVWLGELPLLAIIQLPKINFAGWLRVDVVMELMKVAGYSSGSFSPDYGRARTVALVLAYALPLLGLALAVRIVPRIELPSARLMCLLLALSAFDFGLTLHFTRTAGLTLY